MTDKGNLQSDDNQDIADDVTDVTEDVDDDSSDTSGRAPRTLKPSDFYRGDDDSMDDIISGAIPEFDDADDIEKAIYRSTYFKTDKVYVVSAIFSVVVLSLFAAYLVSDMHTKIYSLYSSIPLAQEAGLYMASNYVPLAGIAGVALVIVAAYNSISLIVRHREFVQALFITAVVLALSAITYHSMTDSYAVVSNNVDIINCAPGSTESVMADLANPESYASVLDEKSGTYVTIDGSGVLSVAGGDARTCQ